MVLFFVLLLFAFLPIRNIWVAAEIPTETRVVVGIFALVFCLGLAAMVVTGLGVLMPRVVDITVTPLYNWGSETEPLLYLEVNGEERVHYIPLPKEGEMPVDQFATEGGNGQNQITIVKYTTTVGQPHVSVVTTRFKYRWMDMLGVSDKNGNEYIFYVPEGSVKYDLPFDQ